MESPIAWLPLIVGQHWGPQRLGRIVEPSPVTEGLGQVLQYDRVMTTNLAVAYAMGLEILDRALAADRRTAVDLACGPGHFTLLLARYLGFREIVGIDLSPPMIRVASENAARLGLADRAQFRLGDITQLAPAGFGAIDLACLTDAAHHLPDLDAVAALLARMDELTRPEGLVLVMDLVRLRTAALVERYVQIVGADYAMRGLGEFLDDFRGSMYAAWTVDELHRAIPSRSRRRWCHLVPRGLPSIQVLLGLPVGRQEPFVRSDISWSRAEFPMPAPSRRLWRMLRLAMRFPWRRCREPRR